MSTTTLVECIICGTRLTGDRAKLPAALDSAVNPGRAYGWCVSCAPYGEKAEPVLHLIGRALVVSESVLSCPGLTGRRRGRQ